MLWLNGGPGCSSSTGLCESAEEGFNRWIGDLETRSDPLSLPFLPVFELGPCSIYKNETVGTKHNPSSWTSAANVIFLDQPGGSLLERRTSRFSRADLLLVLLIFCLSSASVNVGYSYSEGSTVSDSQAAAEECVRSLPRSAVPLSKLTFFTSLCFLPSFTLPLRPLPHFTLERPLSSSGYHLQRLRLPLALYLPVLEVRRRRLPHLRRVLRRNLPSQYRDCWFS